MRIYQIIILLNTAMTTFGVMTARRIPVPRNVMLATTLFLGIAALLYTMISKNINAPIYGAMASYIVTALLLNYCPSSVMIVITLFSADAVGVFKNKKQIIYHPRMEEKICLVACIALLYALRQMELFIIGEIPVYIDSSIVAIILLQVHLYIKCLNKDVITLKSAVRTTKEKSETDPLTGLLNRQSMDTYIIAQSKRAQVFSVIMMDIDNFKKVNDTYGHTEGDRILKELAEVLKKTVRKEDRAFRYGGEEFCVICPATDAMHAEGLAERIRIGFNKNGYEYNGEEKHFTISLGVSESRYGEFTSVKDLIAMSDEALYEAKGRGKNQVVIHKSAQQYLIL